MNEPTNNHASPSLPRWFNSLRFKLALVNLTVVLASLWGFTLFGLSSLRSTLEASQMEQQRASVQYIAAELDQKLRAKLGGLVGAASQLDLSRLDDANYLRAFLQDRYPFQREFSGGTFVFNREGTALADYPVIPGRQGRYYGDRDYFQQALATGKPVVSKPLMARGLKKPSIALSVPVLDAKGVVQAVVMGAVDLDSPEFLGVATDAKRLGSTELYVISVKDELFIASSDKSRLLTSIPAPGQSKVMDKLRTGFEGSMVSVGSQNIEKVYSAVRVPTTDWVMLQAVTTATLFGPVNRLATTLLVGSGIATIVALAVAALFSRRALKQLSQTSDRLNAMSTGEVPLELLPEVGETEVRHLLGSFNRLTRELVSSRDHLEEMVNQRTAELEIKERFLQVLVDALPGLVSFWNSDLHCSFANRGQLDWYDVQQPSEIRATPGGPFHQHEHLLRAALNGERQALEQVWARPDGQTTSVLTYFIPYTVEGAVQGVFAIATDVSLLKQTELQLVDAEASLAVTLASIEAGLIATDRQGRVTRINATAEALLGWTQDEARGRPYWDVLVTENRPVELLGLNPVDVMIEQGIGVDKAHQVVLIARNGPSHSVEAKAALLCARDGSVQGLAMVLRDQSRVRQSQIDFSRLVAIIESSQDAIIGKTLDGRITDWNPAAQTTFGYTADEVLGRPIQMLIPPDRQHEEMRILADLARGVPVPPFDTLRRAKDGRLIEVSVTISPIRDAEGRIVGASKIARDVSAKRRVEEARIKADRLEAENRQMQEASRIKNLFLANMSHELRTPLNAVIGFADLLHSGFVKPESPKHQEFLGHIGTSGRHLLQLINDVLDLSKVESGKFDFFPEHIDLPPLLKEVQDVLHTAVNRKNIHISTAIDADLDDLKLDPARLKQVLYNYMSNAIKFTAADGHVMVRARAEGPEHFRIEVEDTGIGISAADLPRLFTEFQQLDAGYSKQHQGTGLGLALTRRLVQAQGGQVGVRSTVGVGSVFYVVLNRSDGLDTRRTAAIALGVLERKADRMLVIEDDLRDQALMVDALSQVGFEVDAAADSSYALRRARETAYAALTLDLSLPGRRGLELLDDIRSQGASHASPVLGVTMPADLNNSAAFAIANVLCKPIRSDEILSAMTRFRLPGNGRANVMVIDDEQVSLDLMRATLRSIDINAVCFQDGRVALQEIDRHRPDAIVLDLMMPDFDGFQVLDALQRLPAWREVPVFIWTSMLLTDEEYATLARSARAILIKGGGAMETVLEGVRRWRTPVVAAAEEKP